MPRMKRDVPMERLTVMTLAEIAERLGVTPQTVYDAERRALRKIRRALVERGVVTEDGRYSR